MRNRIMAFVAAALFAAGLGFSATSAQAASVGPAGYITFWDGCTGGSSSNHTVGYCGAAWPLLPTGGLNVCHEVPNGANDRFSAFSNNTGNNFKVYTATGCTGSVATLYAGTETGQLASTFNNTITSFKRVS